MPKSVQFVAGALSVAWLTGPADGEQLPWSHDAIRNETDSPEDGQFLRCSLGLGIGKPGFDANADLNGDGVVNGHCGIRAPPMLPKAMSKGAVAGTTGAAL